MRRTFIKVEVELDDLFTVSGADIAALVAQGLAAGFPKVAGVNELDSAPAIGGLLVGKNPDVGGDTGVVEELFGQGDDGLQPVVLQNPATDLALAAASVAGEERGAVHNDGHAAVVCAGLEAVGEHVLQKEKLAVADAGSAGAKPPAVAQPGLRFDVLFINPPVLAVRGIGDQVVESLAHVLVVGEGAAFLDALRLPPILAFHVEIGLADGVGFGIDLLAVKVDFGRGVGLADALLGDGQHPAGAAAGVVDFDDAARRFDEVIVPCQEQVHHQANHVTGGEVLAGVLVGGLVEAADEFFEDGAHLVVGDSVGMQVGLGKGLHYLIEQAGLVQGLDGVAELEVLNDFAHILAEAVEIVDCVGVDGVLVVEQPLKVVVGGVVEDETGGAP